ncbi:hypothetical protein [Bacillus sp. NTK034]|uniref:hypothetical protein n=1 Tax=Bacillus sp. NTK034 TaxID=2802176 RepID=UPI001A8F3B96|nr:hypothetical protein [Bacillus sp. NTK034]MBN8200495.1 hypothetical protein [Bacillus sp. NTK034]
MIKRKLWDGIIMYAGKQAYRSLEGTLRYGLKMSNEEFIHIGHIEIIRVIDKFQTGMRTLKTYVIMCLIAKFKKMKRDIEADIRRANLAPDNVDALEEKLQIKIFQSPVNVERTVINKIMLEKSWHVLRDIEKRAILLEQQGYEQYEIAEMIGVHKRHGNTLLNRAYAKLRKQMGA